MRLEKNPLFCSGVNSDIHFKGEDDGVALMRKVWLGWLEYSLLLCY